VFGRPIGRTRAFSSRSAKAYASTRAAELMVKEATRKYEAGLDCGAEAKWPRCWRRCLLGSGQRLHPDPWRVWFSRRNMTSNAIPRDRLYQVAPISTNLVLSFIAEHVLGMPRSY